MVVVDGAKKKIGKTVVCEVTSLVQTASGRMVKKPRRAPEAEVRPWKNARKC